VPIKASFPGFQFPPENNQKYKQHYKTQKPVSWTKRNDGYGRALLFTDSASTVYRDPKKGLKLKK
jgi:hypothetical protein